MKKSPRILTAIWVFCIALAAFSQVPTNDSCWAAQPLVLHSSLDCPSSAVPGSTALATWEGDEPACDGGSIIGYQDVWYSFNSGSATDVDIRLLIGTIQDWGLEVVDSCQGTSIACGIWPQLNYDAVVTPNTDYLIRVFTNLDFDLPGSFFICLSTVLPPPDCQGAVVKTSSQETEITTCKDGAADPLTIVNTSTAPASYTYVITDVDEFILWHIDDGMFDADTLDAGVYYIHGISYYGNLSGIVPENRLDDVTSDSLCLERSNNAVELTVDVCTSVNSFEGEGWSIRSGSNGALWLRHPNASQRIHVELFDAMGRSVWSINVTTSDDRTQVQLPVDLAHGTYTARVSNGTGHLTVGRLVR